MASVAAVPPAIAVSTTLPASTAASEAATPSAESAASCHVRGCSVRSTAAGSTTMRPNANAVASTRMSNDDP